MTTIQGLGPRQLATLYWQRWRVAQALDELVNGHAVDHLVGTRLHPNRVAVSFRLLARNLAIGLQIREADRPLRAQGNPRARGRRAACGRTARRWPSGRRTAAH